MRSGSNNATYFEDDAYQVPIEEMFIYRLVLVVILASLFSAPAF